MSPFTSDPIDPDELELQLSKLGIELKGGIILSPEEAKEALDLAMTIIETVGTTGVHHKVQDAEKWMKRYYPNWA